MNAVPAVVLASMPFGVLRSPSLALGLLQARLQAAGIATACRHFTIDYAARIGVEAYERIAGGFPRTTSLLGEWIFSHALRPRTAAQQEAYLRHVFGEEELADASGAGSADAHVQRELRLKSLEQILGLAAGAADFVDYAAREILALRPQVVGLTSVFEQNLASLALAQRLRALAPRLVIVLGGANCEGAMGRELARRYPFVDLVVSGEADLVIAPLVAGLLRGETWENSEALRPLVDRGESTPRFLQARMVENLAGQPRPDFDPWFRDLASRPGVAASLEVQIPLESSRGCWWGEKHHCTFCGLNGATMAFRSKPPQQVLEEVRAHAARHPGRRMAFVDNIMDRGYFATLLPELAKLPPGTEFFYEIKSNVTKAQVQALRDAGVRHVQPGIESLSDHVLALMKKGVDAMQNLQLLKWSMEYGVRLDWNILWGFPGETPADYAAMAAMVPWLTHLQPPARGARIRLDRHSPNFRQAAAFGFTRLRPFPSYALVYDDLPPAAWEQLAYFFDADHPLDAGIAEATRPLAEAIAAWQAAHRGSKFFHVARGDAMVLVDTRPQRRQGAVRVLAPLEARLMASCDRARSAAGLARELTQFEPARIGQALQALCRDGAMWSDGRKYLSLAVCLTTFLESRRGARLEAQLAEMLAG